MMNRRTAAAALLAGMMLAPTAGAAKDEAAAKSLPNFKGKLLSGGSFNTDRLRGKPHLLVVGFERVHSADMRAWAQVFKASFPDEAKADYFQIAALPSQIGLMRGFIDKQMVKNTPEVARGKIMTVYAADSLCKQLAIKDRKVVYVFVLDAAGTITHREQGPQSAEAFSRVRERLTAAGVLQPTPSVGSSSDKQPSGR